VLAAAMSRTSSSTDLSMSFTVRLLLCLFLATDVWAGAGKKQAQEPLWRVDLRSFGYTGFVPHGEKWDVRLPAWPICFIDDGSVVAIFITREEPSRLTRRDDAGAPSPLRLHAVVLDTSTGQPRATREWPAQRPRAWVFAVGAGKFVVTTADKIVLYSHDLNTIRELSLPIAKGTSVHMWRVFTSPTGKSILYEYSDHEGSHCFWVDTQQLDVLRSWTDPHAEALGWTVAVSDQRIAVPRDTHKPPYGSETVIRDLDGAWRVVCSEPLGCGRPTFINESTLLLQSAFEMRLIRLTGELLFRRNVPPYTLFSHYYPTAVAAERDRFAVLLGKEKGGVPLLDIMPDFVFDQAMVYDMTRKQWIFTLYAKKARLKNFAGLALSPDGTRMAVLADGILQVFAVPEGPP